MKDTRMKDTGRKSLSMAVTGTPLSGARKRAPRGRLEPPTLPGLADGSSPQRKAAVLYEMPTIRWLLAMHRFQADAYSDDAIADALLETCPRPDDFWLRSEHLALAIRRVTTVRA